MGNGPGKIGRERAPLNAEGDFDVEALPHKSESECASAMPPDVWRGLPRREEGEHRGGGSHGTFVASRGIGVHAGALRHENLARQRTSLDPRDMAIVAITVVLGVVLFDAHDFLNRPRRS